MHKILRDYSESARINAIEENLVALSRYFGKSLYGKLYDHQNLVWFITGVPLSVYNAVVHTRLTKENVQKKINEILSHFRVRKVPMMWWVGPSTQPTNLGTYLQQHGFIHAANLTGMTMNLADLDSYRIPASNLVIEQVKDLQQLKKWVYASVKGFGAPYFIEEPVFEFEKNLGIGEHLQWKRYVGLLDGEPVATSGVLLGAGVAGIYNVSTLPAFRRRGYGAALTIQPLMDAYAMGYHIGILQASSMGKDMYMRIGFEPCCKMRQYIWFEK